MKREYFSQFTAQGVKELIPAKLSALSLLTPALADPSCDRKEIGESLAVKHWKCPNSLSLSLLSLLYPLPLRWLCRSWNDLLEFPHPKKWFFPIEAFEEAKRWKLKPSAELGFKIAKKGFESSGRKN